MRKRSQAREFALQILYQHEMNAEPAGPLLESFWAEHPGVSEEVRTFSETIVRGTLSHVSELDSLISRYAENWQLKRMASIDRNILRFAVYELIFLDDIPPKVTINEAVNIAKKYSQEEAGKFVNGVLDKIVHTEQKGGTQETVPHPDAP